MSNVVMKVENLFKQYRLGQVSIRSLPEDLKAFFAKIRGREDERNLVTSINDRTIAANSPYVWALNDISFEVRAGDILGIIGKNGAGKSTLLKILSRITTPTRGEVKIKGKVGSLLEVGTGFHPELSGRENIFLNGAILGMRRAEIQKKLDEIIDFSGVERYIDTPIKRYSSGMKVRLGFAVAAHLEPEILIVDEVLAVGDAEFQKKCLGKMNSISKDQGRTIIFVSHNMGALSSLCPRSLYLKNGQLVSDGPTKEVITQYFQTESQMASLEIEPVRSKPASIRSIRTITDAGKSSSEFEIDQSIAMEIVYETYEYCKSLMVALILETEQDVVFYSFNTDDSEYRSDFQPGQYRAVHTIPSRFLKEGTYYLTVNLGRQAELIHGVSNAVSFKVVANNFDTNQKGYRQNREGLVVTPGVWKNF